MIRSGKRFSIGLWVLVFAGMALLSACSGGGGGNGTAGTGEMSGPRTTPPEGGGAEGNGANFEQQITLNWLSFNPPETDDTKVQRLLEEKFNVKFNVIRVERSEYRQQINLRVSTGDIPDLIYLDGPKDVSDFAAQGILAELPIDEIREKLPAYSPTVDEVDPNLWKYALVDGKNYAIPLYWEIGNMPFLPAYNGAWLKKIGYDHAPTTLEEFEDVLRKFTFDDPDGNGRKDTFGYSGQGADGRSFGPVFSAFGTKNGFILDDTGKIVHGLTTDGAKETFKLLNKWYQEGLIDPEFITKDPNTVHNDFINGIVGVRDWQSYQFNTITGIIGPRFKEKNPDAELVVGKLLQGPAGKPKAYSYGAVNGYIAMGAHVEKEEAKKERMYAILNALSSDPETYLLASYGIEGEHYDMVDGVAVPRPEYSSEVTRNKVGAGTFFSLFYTKSRLLEHYDLSDEILEYIQTVSEDVETYPTIVGFVQAQTDFPDSGKVAEQYIINFITGAMDVESHFQQFVDEFNKAGNAAILEQFNEKYGDIYKK